MSPPGRGARSPPDPSMTKFARAPNTCRNISNHRTSRYLQRMIRAACWVLCLVLRIALCASESHLQIVSPLPFASLKTGYFELEFIAAWQEMDDVQQIHAVIGGGFGVPGGYVRDLSYLLTQGEGYNGNGERTLSVALRTPFHQVVTKIGLVLLGPEGHNLATFVHEVYVSPERKMASSCVLSYPGSGNHLIRFLIEFITMRPTLGVDFWQDQALAENDYNGENPLHDVDLLARPSTEKFHHTRNYFPVHEEKRNFRERCGTKLVVVMRDFFECIPRFLNSVRELNKEASVSERLTVELRVYLDALLAYANFNGPKLLVPYASLVSNPSAVAVGVGRLLQANETRVREWVRRSESLTEQCLNAKGRAWQGQHRSGPSHTESWTVEELLALYKEALQLTATYSAEVQQLMAASLDRFAALLYQRTAASPSFTLHPL